jgi:hypothetical protein
MNNEFEWRNEMRKLGGPTEPARDLWPEVAGRLAVRQSRRPRLLRVGLAIAATLVMVCAAGLIAHRVLQRSGQAGADAVIPRTALEWAQPANPTFASAAQDLDGASAQLQQALEQRPDAVFLVGLLNRTNGQRVRLLQLPYAG